jgi:hypothetical protein
MPDIHADIFVFFFSSLQVIPQQYLNGEAGIQRYHADTV